MMKWTPILLIGILSLSVFLQGMVIAQAQTIENLEKKEYVIVFDEAHGQYFDHTRLKTALSSLNDSINGITYYVKINKNDFNDTSTFGADLIIIPNTGFKEDGSLDRLTSAEEIVVLDYMSKGGSLLLMGNPLTLDKNITGHTEQKYGLNHMLTRIPAVITTGVTFTEPEFAPEGNKTDIIVNPYVNKYGNQSFLLVDKNYFNETDPVFNGIQKVNKILTYTQSLKIDPDDKIASKYIAASSPNGSYSLAFDKEPSDEISLSIVNTAYPPVWFARRDRGNSSRTAIIGSTIMFSDLPVEKNGTEKWIEQEDNLKLFQNLIAWLVGITPLPEAEPAIAGPFYLLVITNIIAGISIAAIIILTGWVYYRKIMKTRVGKVFQKGKKDKETTQETLQEKAKAQPSKSTKKQNKKKTKRKGRR